MTASKKNILFLCTGNSCRSQMAEGFAKYFHQNTTNSFSAGTKKHGLNPKAVLVMKEIGIDITDHFSKTVKELNVEFDYVFTVCGHANETCPHFPHANIIHIGFEDPPTLTKDMTNEEEVLDIYRRVRDEIKEFVEKIEF